MKVRERLFISFLNFRIILRVTTLTLEDRRTNVEVLQECLKKRHLVDLTQIIVRACGTNTFPHRVCCQTNAELPHDFNKKEPHVECSKRSHKDQLSIVIVYSNHLVIYLNLSIDVRRTFVKLKLSSRKRFPRPRRGSYP